MFIALASISKDPSINRAVLEQMAAAVEVQLYQHYAPFWQSAGVNVRVVEADDPILKQQDAAPLMVMDTADQPDALGYHELLRNAQVSGKVFWSPILTSGGTLIDGANSLSVTLSHEALEALGDPYVNFWADMDAETMEAIELCDRVEADAYTIDGVAVSNFLGPRAFRNGPGPYDWMGLLQNPWDVRPGGYVIRRKGSQVFNVYGSKYPEYRKTMKTDTNSKLVMRQVAVSHAS